MVGPLVEKLFCSFFPVTVLIFYQNIRVVSKQDLFNPAFASKRINRDVEVHQFNFQEQVNLIVLGNSRNR